MWLSSTTGKWLSVSLLLDVALTESTACLCNEGFKSLVSVSSPYYFRNRHHHLDYVCMTKQRSPYLWKQNVFTGWVPHPVFWVPLKISCVLHFKALAYTWSDVWTCYREAFLAYLTIKAFRKALIQKGKAILCLVYRNQSDLITRSAKVDGALTALQR